MPKSKATLTSKQNVLITGVSSGIGLGMAQQLLDQGHNVYGSVRSAAQADRLNATMPENFRPLVFDITSDEQIDHSKNLLLQSNPGLKFNAIVNNAGIAEIGPLLHVSMETLERHLNVLVTSQLRVIQAFFEWLDTSQSELPSRIFNISSISGVNPNPLFGSYTAGKHGLEGMSKTLRKELRAYGVKLVVVAPGNISTNIWTKQTNDLALQYKNTDYYQRVLGYINGLKNIDAKKMMTVDEFSESFCEVFHYSDPSERYTIIKKRKWKYPLSLLTKQKTRIFAG